MAARQYQQALPLAVQATYGSSQKAEGFVAKTITSPSHRDARGFFHHASTPHGGRLLVSPVRKKTTGDNPMTNAFPSVNYTEMLGITPISLVPDKQIWEHLVTPQVKAFLGEVQGEPVVQVQDTVSGEFPGDEVTNLNGHLLYGKPGYVRFPYIQTVYRTKYGCLIIKRDGLKFKVTAWVGKRGRQELIFRASLRDRRFDGSKRADDCSLIDFTYADNINAPLSKDGKPLDAKSVELSIYAFMPGSKIAAACGEPEFEEFVRSPFSFVNRPKVFLKHFRRAWKTERAPGQVANPIPDVSGLVLPAFEKFAID
ncbi:MAG: hypothetical protein IAF58_02680, partial [Leptolyngbya sp.]|nr:hypothetical protein [Candidatus Melainabacteria bacterium]